ncbi:hypothetical protein CHS0354_039279 [Potamilus streckersoni]|uniref:C2H2-type domain-containing protein n=1 Tax=Potamilus streckersoni TaxID=2493646 RepID=A0AAE0VGY9_9BIVA|nr:hypothetical protein CHS0354_039279 [Potamilus streckersoni]
MATVGCSSMHNDEMGDKCAANFTLLCKKNGVNHNCYCEESLNSHLTLRSQFLDKFKRLNGNVKAHNNNSFPRPSIPTLRSKRERHSSGSESKRKRRSSRHDKGDIGQGLNTDAGQTEVESLEVASITQKAASSSCIATQSCKSAPVSRVGPRLSTDSSEQVTPDTSRSCTPQSLGGGCLGGCGLSFLTPSPNSQDGYSNHSSNQCKDSTTTTTEAATPTLVNCQWKNCDISLAAVEVMDHIRIRHVEPQDVNETFVCLWEGCKVFNKSSCSRSWLDRHILCHSGDKPFRCIVEGCGMRFTSQHSLERHVNSHFSALEHTPNNKQTKCREDTPTKLWKRKRLKTKGRFVRVRATDFFDSGIMERLQQELSNIANQTQIDLNGSNNLITFHSTVIARRTDQSGKVHVLLHWNPEDILPDDWVLESQVPSLTTQCIPFNQLPRDSVLNLHPALYHQHRYRKHRRK